MRRRGKLRGIRVAGRSGTVRYSAEPAGNPASTSSRRPVVHGSCRSVGVARHSHLRQVDAFIPMVDAIMFVGDSVTATLLYTQAAVFRSEP